jgi:hypothetical protein
MISHRQRQCDTGGLSRLATLIAWTVLVACAGANDVADDESSGSDAAGLPTASASPAATAMTRPAGNPASATAASTPPSAATGVSPAESMTATPVPVPDSAAPASGSGSAPAGSAPAGSAPAGNAAPEDPAAALSFAKDIWPIFNSKCGPCHVTEHIGGHNVGSANKAAALADAIRREDDIISEIRSRDMPPGCSSASKSDDFCVTDTEFKQIRAWFDAGTPP